MVAAKQNQKFPFHFLSAPPTPPAEENKKGKENFWFLLPRPPHQSKLGAGQAPGANEARRLVLAQIVLAKTAILFFGCRTWNRTKILSFKGSCPTFRRSGNIKTSFS